MRSARRIPEPPGPACYLKSLLEPCLEKFLIREVRACLRSHFLSSVFGPIVLQPQVAQRCHASAFPRSERGCPAKTQSFLSSEPTWKSFYETEMGGVGCLDSYTTDFVEKKGFGKLWNMCLGEVAFFVLLRPIVQVPGFLRGVSWLQERCSKELFVVRSDLLLCCCFLSFLAH